MKSIMDTEDGVCYLCGRMTNTETHHCMGGIGNRKLSDADGLTVELCHDCHHRCHNGENSAKIRNRLHREAQTIWIEHYGPDLLRQGKDPLAEFMKRYGRNWL